MPTTQTASKPRNLKPILPAEVRFASNGDGAKTAKVQLVARSGEPVYSPYWGNIVHDFSGMDHKPRIPIDYEHWSDSIGYLNKFDTSSGDLVCSGALVSVTLGDCPDFTASLMEKMDAGIPYQASIQFGDDVALEFIPEGMTASVNGNDVAGPVTIVRQWTLQAVAICKLGVDDDTSAELQMSNSEPAANGFVRVNFNGGIMSKTNSPTVEAPAIAGAKAGNQLSQAKGAEVPAQAVAVEAPKGGEVAQPEQTQPATQPAVMSQAAPTVEPQKASDGREEFRKFSDAFGDRAAKYFSEGKSFDVALADHLKWQQEQITALQTRLSAAPVDRGAIKPVQFADGEKPTATPEATRLAANYGDNIAKIAMSMKLPTAPTATK
jgi:hypothetical protein